MKWFCHLVLKRFYRRIMREAGIKSEFYCFCVSMSLYTTLKSSWNDDTLSILQILVYIDQAEDLIFLSSTSLEHQPKKERVYLLKIMAQVLQFYGTRRHERDGSVYYIQWYTCYTYYTHIGTHTTSTNTSTKYNTLVHILHWYTCYTGTNATTRIWNT